VCLKVFFENFEKILSKRLKREIKEKEKNKIDQTLSSLFQPSLLFLPPPPRGPT
jgi:hypothetical protein